MSYAQSTFFQPWHFALFFAFFVGTLLWSRMSSSISKNIAPLEKRRALEKLTSFKDFKTIFKSEFGRVQRYERPLSILSIEVDDLKHFTKHYGEESSDRLVREVAWIMFESTRGSDIVSVTQNQKFLILLPETIHDKAMLLAWRIRKLVETFPFDFENRHQQDVTISVGVASPLENTQHAYELYILANQALKQAKEKKNMVFSFNHKDSESHDPIELADGKPKFTVIPGKK